MRRAVSYLVGSLPEEIPCGLHCISPSKTKTQNLQTLLHKLTLRGVRLCAARLLSSKSEVELTLVATSAATKPMSARNSNVFVLRHSFLSDVWVCFLFCIPSECKMMIVQAFFSLLFLINGSFSVYNWNLFLVTYCNHLTAPSSVCIFISQTHSLLPLPSARNKQN